MRLRHLAPITIRVDGEPSTFRAYQVGRFGTGPCPCGHQPVSGDRVWCNNYGELRCDACARNEQRS